MAPRVRLGSFKQSLAMILGRSRVSKSYTWKGKVRMIAGAKSCSCPKLQNVDGYRFRSRWIQLKTKVSLQFQTSVSVSTNIRETRANIEQTKDRFRHGIMSNQTCLPTPATISEPMTDAFCNTLVARDRVLYFVPNHETSHSFPCLYQSGILKDLKGANV